MSKPCSCLVIRLVFFWIVLFETCCDGVAYVARCCVCRFFWLLAIFCSKEYVGVFVISVCVYEFPPYVRFVCLYEGCDFRV